MGVMRRLRNVAVDEMPEGSLRTFLSAPTREIALRSFGLPAEGEVMNAISP
jgi:hypothetical protein